MVRVFRRDSSAVIQVCDDGPGFPPDIDVLARYVTGPRGGTGLGLPLVLWIAERHGATFSFENGTAERPGAVVEIVLPVDESVDEQSNLRVGRGHGRRALSQGRRSS